ncbi:hypothetical protein BH10CHL1_BH10CHL1_39250 [soil metagenome]
MAVDAITANPYLSLSMPRQLTIHKHLRTPPSPITQHA